MTSNDRETEKAIKVTVYQVGNWLNVVTKQLKKVMLADPVKAGLC